jgi:ATP-dependent DNA helicase RecG
MLAEAFEKLRLVERAGIGRRRIFIPMLSFGKRLPQYETDGGRVTLRLFDGSFDELIAVLVTKWRDQGRTVDLDGLLVLTYLREHAFIDTASAAELLQIPRDTARSVLDQLAKPRTGILERRGMTKAATYHLNKAVARELFGKTAYTKTKGWIHPLPRNGERVCEQLWINHTQECRELWGLGESPTARVEVSRYLKKWSDQGLRRVGTRVQVSGISLGCESGATQRNFNNPDPCRYFSC